MQLDRYCQKAMSETLLEALASVRSPMATELNGQIVRITPNQRLNMPLDGGEFFMWAVRHKSTDNGQFHVRKVHFNHTLAYHR